MDLESCISYYPPLRCSFNKYTQKYPKVQHFSVTFLCMQTFFNPTTPFFDAEGHPTFDAVGLRVKKRPT